MKLASMLAACLGLAVATAAGAEPPDPAFVATLAKYGRPVRGRFEGRVCASSVALPPGVIGYVDNTQANSDVLTIPLGGQRVLTLWCGPAPSYAPTSQAYVGYTGSGRDKSIKPGSVTVRPSRMGGLDAVRIDLGIITDAPPASAFRSTEVVAYDKAPTGGTRYRALKLTTTVDHARADEQALDAMLAGYQAPGSK